MNSIFQFLLYAHIVSGFISLILFWIPVFTRKGGKRHRKTGVWYIRMMWVVVFTAAILSLKNLVIGRTNMGMFLGFIALITANPLWYGIAILKHKNPIPKSFYVKHQIFKLAIVTSAIGMIVYGFISMKTNSAYILMFIFGGLGLTDIPGVYRYISKKARELNPLREHVIGMSISGIAAYTAFFVFGANQYLELVLSGNWMILPWVLPTVIGLVAIRLATAKFKTNGETNASLE